MSRRKENRKKLLWGLGAFCALVFVAALALNSAAARAVLPPAAQWMILCLLLLALFAAVFLVIRRIVSQSDRLQREITDQAERYRMAIAAVSDAVVDYHHGDDSIFLGDQFFQMLGVPGPPRAEAIPLKRFFELIGPENAHNLRTEYNLLRTGGQRSLNLELDVRRADGKTVWLQLRAKALYQPASGKLLRAIGSISEITIRKVMEEEMNNLAYYDNLTKIPNRAFLYEALAELVHNDAVKAFAVFFIDLDDFKLVNDSQGHDGGDQLLTRIAAFLTGSLSQGRMVYRPAAGAMSIAVRFGGDEFVLLSTGVRTEAEAMEFANGMLAAFHRDLAGDGLEDLPIGMSIGVALYPRDATNDKELLKCADIAMYHAKQHGKNKANMFRPEMKMLFDKQTIGG